MLPFQTPTVMVSLNQLTTPPLQEAIQYVPLSTPSSRSNDTRSQPMLLLIGLNQTSPSRIPERLVRQNEGQHKVKQEEFNGGDAFAFVSIVNKDQSKTSNGVLGERHTADSPEHDDDDDDSGNEPSTASSTSSSGSDDSSGSVVDERQYSGSRDDNDNNDNHHRPNTTNNNGTVSSTPCATPTTINHCSPSLVVPITSPKGCTQSTKEPDALGELPDSNLSLIDNPSCHDYHHSYKVQQPQRKPNSHGMVPPSSAGRLHQHLVRQLPVGGTAAPVGLSNKARPCHPSRSTPMAHQRDGHLSDLSILTKSPVLHPSSLPHRKNKQQQQQQNKNTTINHGA